MKLNKEILKVARHEASSCLNSDLVFSEALHAFFKKENNVKAYLEDEYGFRKFLFDYKVGRTLKAGDDAKLKILRLIQKFPFSNNHVQNISSLATTIKQKGWSSNSGNSGPGLPQSFCSKLLYVYKPHEIIPYDSYALKSLQLWSGKSLKTLQDYYSEADRFRLTYFPESGEEVISIRNKTDKKLLTRLTALQIDPVKQFSWKLTDKYLWCDEWTRRINK